MSRNHRVDVAGLLVMASAIYLVLRIVSGFLAMHAGAS